MEKDKKIVILEELFKAKKLYRFNKSRGYENYALPIEKGWIEKNGIEVDEKVWVMVKYEGNSIIISPVDQGRFAEVVNLTLNTIREVIVEKAGKNES